MKTIFITVGEATPARNILRSSFWGVIKGKARIILITTNEKSQVYRKEFGDNGVIVEEIPPFRSGMLEKVFVFISRNALRTGTTKFNQMRQYVDGGSIFVLILKRFLSVFWGRSFVLQKVIRLIEERRNSDSWVVQLYDKYKPAGVFSTVAINAEVDVPIIREAKKRGIKTVAMLRGWDNFTSHGFLRILPDRFLLQNEFLRQMSLRYQFLNPSAVEVVGFPQNDWYFRKDWILPREEFLKNIGVDPAHRIILYGAMGDFLFPCEGEVAEIFEDLMSSKKLPEDLIMIFRAHPAFKSPLERMKGLKFVVPDRNASYTSPKVSSWEMGEKEMAYLLNSIVHSEMVITAGSTMALDGVALGKPIIMVAFEKTRTNYWLSARRFIHHYTHFGPLIESGGMSIARNSEELAGAVEKYLRNHDADSEGRKKIEALFLAPFDGHSGERIAGSVLRYLGI